jgi:hypothetical protein
MENRIWDSIIDTYFNLRDDNGDGIISKSEWQNSINVFIFYEN